MLEGGLRKEGEMENEIQILVIYVKDVLKLIFKIKITNETRLRLTTRKSF